ncbi:hypothetical protein NOGI109294_10235 [Nocardiopsis gilva]|nr:hypothetical protein [Nocardiopsis gilva]
MTTIPSADLLRRAAHVARDTAHAYREATGWGTESEEEADGR